MSIISAKTGIVDKLDAEAVSKLVRAIADDNQKALKRKKKAAKRKRKKAAKSSG